MRAFMRRRGRYVAELDATERTILARVVIDTATLLGDSPPPAEDEPDQDTTDVTDSTDSTDTTDATDTSDRDRSAGSPHTPAAGGTPRAGHGPARAAPHGTGAGRESLADQISRLGQDVPEPTDPALARLLPPASHDDAALAREFRRLTQDELRNDKITRLRMVGAALRAPGTKLTVEPDQALDWAAALTDVRLVLSERLNIRTDEDAEEIYALAADRRTQQGGAQQDLRLALASVYAAFTWLQESLVQVMLPTLGE